MSGKGAAGAREGRGGEGELRYISDGDVQIG